MSKVDSIQFRMYNTGSVGDCLLLLFKKGKTISFSMLIDCGGWNTNAALITPVVEQIREACNGSLDLLVVTHQHLDHVSGFNQAKSVFDQIAVKKVWMSWVENKSDPIAKVLKTKYGKALRKLDGDAARAMAQLKSHAQAAPQVRGFDAKTARRQQRMEDTLRLIEFEMGYEPGQKGAKAARPTNDTAMEYVRDKGEIEYRLPGEVVSGLAGAEGIKFYILGPPRDRDMKFFKIALKEEEMYHLAMNSPTEQTDMPAEESILETGILLEAGVSPFGAEYAMNAAELRAFNRDYQSEDMQWRQIETDWLETAASIALRATRLTNNTSLAMAIEFEDSGRVLLLPGDAQSGNWMGWHKPDVSRDLKQNGGLSTVELLNHTVFYKVGHHGSHNGTASVSGLEHMKSPDLVAMMPLVQSAVPDEWGGANNFPAKALYKVLIEKTKGRLLRTDEGAVTAAKAKTLRAGLTSQEKAAFKKAYVKGDKFVEFTIKG